MKFKDAFNEAVINGKIIRRKSWSGYWYWDNGTILIVSKGETTDIRETRDVSYTIRNTFEDDWEVGAQKVIQKSSHIEEDEDEYCDFEGNHLY